MFGMPCQCSGSLRQIVITPDAEGNSPDAGCHPLAATRYGGSLEQDARRNGSLGRLVAAARRSGSPRNSRQPVADRHGSYDSLLQLAATRYALQLAMARY